MDITNKLKHPWLVPDPVSYQPLNTTPSLLMQRSVYLEARPSYSGVTSSANVGTIPIWQPGFLEVAGGAELPPESKDVRQAGYSMNRLHVSGLSKTAKRNMRRKRVRQIKRQVDREMHSADSIPAATYSSLNRSKRQRSDTSTSSPIVGKPVEKTMDKIRSGTCGATASITNVAIMSENFPNEYLNNSDVGPIQKELLRCLDEEMHPTGELLPQINNFALTDGALVYVCENEQTEQWLFSIFDGNDKILKGIRLKVTRASELQKPVKVSFRTKDIWTRDANILFRRLNLYDASLHTAHWEVLNYTQESKFVKWIIQVDRRSAKAIANARFSAYTGVDKGIFKILDDPLFPRNVKKNIQVGAPSHSAMVGESEMTAPSDPRQYLAVGEDLVSSTHGVGLHLADPCITQL